MTKTKMTNYINMECVIPAGEMYFQYPTRSLIMFELVRECLRMLNTIRECSRIISNEYSPRKIFSQLSNVLLRTYSNRKMTIAN